MGSWLVVFFYLSYTYGEGVTRQDKKREGLKWTRPNEWDGLLQLVGESKLKESHMDGKGKDLARVKVRKKENRYHELGIASKWQVTLLVGRECERSI